MARPEEKEGRIWAATQFNIGGRTINKPNPSVLAASVGASDIKGRRGKLIMDDVEGEDAQWSPLKRSQLYSWLKLEAWRCLEDTMESDRPLLCMLGTPFDVDSIYFEMERQGWEVIRYSAFISEWTIDWQGREDYRPVYLWGEKKQKVEEAKTGLRKREFSIAYRMDPTGGDPSLLSSQQIQENMRSAAEITEDSIAFIALDPASGSQASKRPDYAGIAVVKIRWERGAELPDVEILEADEFTGGLFEQVHHCARLYESYQYPVLYENNGQQGQTYAEAFGHLQPHVPLLEYYTVGAKKFDAQMGLTVIKRLAVVKKLRVPADKLESEGVQTLIREIRDLQPPFKQHDHLCMAIWFAVRYVYERVRHYRGPKLTTTYSPAVTMSGPRHRFGYGMGNVLRSGYGYTVAGAGHDRTQAAMAQEIEAFRKRRRGPEAIERERQSEIEAYNRRVNK